MADPVTTKLSTQVMAKALENSQAETAKPVSPEGGSFKQTMESTEAHMRIMDILGVDQQNQVLPSGKMESISAESITLEQDNNAIPKAGGPEGGEKVLNMLADFNNQQSQMDLLVNQIMYGDKKFSNQELMAIQAHVFHIAQMTELTVKSVELAVSSFKGVMNTQIQ